MGASLKLNKKTTNKCIFATTQVGDSMGRLFYATTSALACMGLLLDNSVFVKFIRKFEVPKITNDQGLFKKKQGGLQSTENSGTFKHIWPLKGSCSARGPCIPLSGNQI